MPYRATAAIAMRSHATAATVGHLRTISRATVDRPAAVGPDLSNSAKRSTTGGVTGAAVVARVRAVSSTAAGAGAVICPLLTVATFGTAHRLPSGTVIASSCRLAV